MTTFNTLLDTTIAFAQDNWAALIVGALLSRFIAAGFTWASSMIRRTAATP